MCMVILRSRSDRLADHVAIGKCSAEWDNREHIVETALSISNSIAGRHRIDSLWCQQNSSNSEQMHTKIGKSIAIRPAVDIIE